MTSNRARTRTRGGGGMNGGNRNLIIVGALVVGLVVIFQLIGNAPWATKGELGDLKAGIAESRGMVRELGAKVDANAAGTAGRNETIAALQARIGATDAALVAIREDMRRMAEDMGQMRRDFEQSRRHRGPPSGSP